MPDTRHNVRDAVSKMDVHYTTASCHSQAIRKTKKLDKWIFHGSNIYREVGLKMCTYTKILSREIIFERKIEKNPFYIYEVVAFSDETSHSLLPSRKKI